jgi:ketosteroid isomerase-like protein
LPGDVARRTVARDADRRRSNGKETAMNFAGTGADNAALIRRAYEAFGRGDVPAVLEVLDPDITWHVPGRSPLSGDYKGHPGVLEFFGRCQTLSAGTLRVVPDEVLAEGDRVVALTTVSAERHGQAWSSPEVHVWEVAGGRAVEFVEYQGDEQTEDEFWLA